jgi:hypothetical protein
VEVTVIITGTWMRAKLNKHKDVVDDDSDDDDGDNDDNNSNYDGNDITIIIIIFINKNDYSVGEHNRPKKTL